MHFTREPIVESVITPREGCKLVIRSSRGQTQEEYFVDAIEVVSFGAGFFFRSLERPKSFLVPASDYEVVEVRETRMVLRHAQVAEKTIKIAGGRERSERESSDDSGSKDKRKKERRKRGRRRGREDEGREEIEADDGPALPDLDGGLPQEEEEPFVPPTFASILPPPTTLIGASLSQYKQELAEVEEPQSEAPAEEEPSSSVLGSFSPGHLIRRFLSEDEESSED